MIRNSNDKTNFLNKLLLTDAQVWNIRKAIANASSANINLSKTQLSKMLKSGEFMHCAFDITTSLTTGLSNLFNLPTKIINSY